ncbi:MULTISPECIES: AAA family ATPase [Pseudomonas]|uniref:AAA family ATPase n=1 Tax=Pseudomonas quercus TaxID=2722792 RepID=A0ABX0YKA0_9PSED|nr:AAA family ATPase [Pseudomonas sp. LY10J]MBF7144129.1 AAA family ATPase [Pseudomonas sp. LY10J]NJP02739.1 AAA family ATPase [Pseudomonas quercus]
MQLTFIVLKKPTTLPPTLKSTVLFSPSNWDDYSFKTLFGVVFFGVDGKKVDLGSIKIGYVDQPHGWTSENLKDEFTSLDSHFFSLGQDVDFYKKIHDELSIEESEGFLTSLKDVIYDEKIFNAVKDESVFRNSLMRNVSRSVIEDQFRRVLAGLPESTEFDFAYEDKGDDRRAPVRLSFKVMPGSMPTSNVHVLIGRNGVGKTTILNDMVETLLCKTTGRPHNGNFYVAHPFSGVRLMPEDYFSSIVSVSFSAFDPFLFPEDQPDRSKGVAYFYVGMQSTINSAGHRPPKAPGDLKTDFIDSLSSCLSQPTKRHRWLKAIKRLESDANFEEMTLGRLADMPEDEALVKAGLLFGRMSSGHSIVLLTTTKLVDTVEEKTLVLMDEPESHLHPPLLSAFTRAVSDLLQNRNGVAIIATHSPVVVQEVPRLCVWKLTRNRTEGRSDRPERETFGENAGILTREIFGLEVSKSGYHAVLQAAVDKGGTFESIYDDYKGQLGFEAQAILQKLISARLE